MRVHRDVVVKLVHVLERLFLAHEVDEARHGEEARAGGVRVAHDYLALELGTEKVLVGFDFGKPLRLRFGGVVDYRRLPGVDADPCGRVRGVLEHRLDALEALRRVGLYHAAVLEHEQARSRRPPDDVGGRLFALGEKLRRDDAGRVADYLYLNVGIFLAEGCEILVDLLVLKRGVDRELLLLRSESRARKNRGGGCDREHSFAKTTPNTHENPPQKFVFTIPSLRTLL